MSPFGLTGWFSLPGVDRLSSAVSQHSSRRRVDAFIFQQVSLQGIQRVVLILSHRDGQRFIQQSLLHLEDEMRKTQMLHVEIKQSRKSGKCKCIRYEIKPRGTFKSLY